MLYESSITRCLLPDRHDGEHIFGNHTSRSTVNVIVLEDENEPDVTRSIEGQEKV